MDGFCRRMGGHHEANQLTRRVCHISTMTRMGGVERLVVDLLTHPPQADIRHALLTTSSDPAVLRPLSLSPSLSIYEPSRRFRYDPTAIIAMAKWLRQQKIDVVHTYNAFANAWGFLAAKLARVPTIFAGEHGSAWWVKPPMLWLDRWAQRNATLTIANSHASTTMLTKRYGLAREKIRVVHNGVPPLPPADRKALRREWGWGDCVVVGTIGRLDTPKNYHILLQAVSQLRHPKMRLLIIGGGPLEGVLRDQIATLGLGDRCVLTGWRSDARQLIQGCDIFVNTSLRETFGLVLVEAGLAGLPLVAPAVDGIPEIVQDRVNGILLQPTEKPTVIDAPDVTPLSQRVVINGELSEPLSVSAETVTHALHTLITDNDLRLHYGQQAKTIAQERFSLDRYQRELEAIYLC